MRQNFLWLWLLCAVCIWGAITPDANAQNANTPLLMNDLSGWKIEGSVTQAAPDAPIVLRASEIAPAAISRTAKLQDGLQEVLIEAAGRGTLTLEAGAKGELGEREMALGENKGLYGLTFVGKVGVQTLRVTVDGEAQIFSIRLQPATEEQKVLYQKRQDEIVQLGFYSTDFQRPEPVANRGDTLAPDPTWPAAHNIAVLDDPRAYESVHVKNSAHLRQWLRQNGAQLLAMEKLETWLAERLQKGDAYGSAMVFTYGFEPSELFENNSTDAPWLRYLKDGGRIVNLGDVPLYQIDSVSGRARNEPFVATGATMPLDALHLPYGWSQPLWGKGFPIKETRFGTAWGMENTGSPLNGFPAERLTQPFFTYVTEKGLVGASSWFKNFSPAKPWGGLVQVMQDYDGNNDSALRDVWRAIHFAGAPLSIPPLPAAGSTPATTPAIHLAASGMENRSAVAIGETIAFTIADANPRAVKWTLHAPQSAPLALPSQQAGAQWDSQNWAPGQYTIEANWNEDGKARSVRRDFALAGVPHRDFNYQMWLNLSKNPARNQAMLADVRAANMDVYLTEPTPEYMDQVLAAGMLFSARVHSQLTPPGKEISFEKTPEYFRLDINHKPFPYAYAGGRPTPGISHPDVLAEAARSLREDFSKIKNHPAFMDVVIGNDDFSTKYGWDFSPHVTARFTKQTGLEAPSAKPDSPAPGLVDDSDPWQQWVRFSLRDISGLFNRTQQSALDAEKPGARFGPIPGGMQIPLIQTWSASQYPPLNFGANGFKLISSYYYNSYWQPPLANTFWLEAGKMGNRDLDQWLMPDCYQGGASYARNNFYHLLAGGATGLPYYRYAERRAPQWDELKKLGRVVENLAPTQAALRPAKRRVALLISLSTLAYDPMHALQNVYAYCNLMQAGYSVDLISEEEILAGSAKNYQAIVLYNVGWLQRSTGEKLREYSRGGGLVLLDATTALDLPGAQRLQISLGSGQEQTPTKTHVPQSDGYGTRDSYGRTTSIARVREAMAKWIAPDFSAPDVRLTMSKFRIGSTPHLWLVNALDGDEYSYAAQHAGAGVPGAGTRDKMLELWKWGDAQIAAGDFQTEMTLPDKIGAAYDLANVKRVAVKPAPQGGSTLSLSLPRFGGALLALTSEPVGALQLTAPTTALPERTITLSAQLIGAISKKNLREALPIHFELTAPDGTKYFDNRGVLATNGAASFEWTPARNDRKGKWAVLARQRASGKEARATIILK